MKLLPIRQTPRTRPCQTRLVLVLSALLPLALHAAVEPPESVTVEGTVFSGALLSADARQWTNGFVRVALADDGTVAVSSPSQSLVSVTLSWKRTWPKGARMLADVWERAYGDLKWTTIGAERLSPWYFLVTDGRRTDGIGVAVQPNALACWKVDSAGYRLRLDLRAGGRPVRLGARTLAAARIVMRAGGADESAFASGRAFCRLMCPKTPPLKEPVYGYNDWYCAYGRNTATNFLADAAYIVECAKGLKNRPYVVMDDGWQKNSPPVVGNDSGHGPWDRAGDPFGMDMATFARKVAALGAKPGLWYRPFRAYAEMPDDWKLKRDARYVDPSVPAVRERIREDITRFRNWGYKLVKIDYLTYDICNQWGGDRGRQADRLIRDDREWRDSSRTTVEVIKDLMQTMRTAAGDDVVLIGCNGLNHLVAGLFELQRIGDDTSGREWARTRDMGVNALGFRAIQDRIFFAADADCVGLCAPGAVPWEKNAQWLDLVARSGTPLFISWHRRLATREFRTALAAAFRRAAVPQPQAEPLDWCAEGRVHPREWRFGAETKSYDWCDPAGPRTCTATVGKDGDYATLAEAVSVLRGAAPGCRKEIVLRDGTHFVPTQLAFAAADSNFVFRAEHPGKARITGAKRVASFRPDPQDQRLWEAEFPFKPAPETLYVLTVNGRLAEFAAYPQYGGDRKLRYNASESDAVSNNFTVLEYDPLDLPKGYDFRAFDCASAFLFIPQEYASTRAYVATNDWRHNTFHLKNRTSFPIGRFNQGYQVMNTRLGLRHPGTWMFESGTGKIRYWPTDEDRRASATEATVACTSGLFYFDGSSDVRFEGLVLEGCASPFAVDCHLKPIPGLVTAHEPKRFVLADCVLRHTAGAGVHFVRPADCVTRGCHLYGLGSYGIHHFWGGTRSVVANCHVHDNGLYALAAPAIELQGLDGCSVVSNHVHHTPGCGFVMWCEYSVFASNHLHHTMQSVRDGGGLYGGQNHSKLFDNYVHDCGDWPGLYNDEGGYGSVYYGNRFENCWWPIHMHDTYGIVLTNNVFRSDDYMRFSLQGAIHTVFRDNRIDSPLPIESFPQLEACDTWANDVRVKRADGSYGPYRRVTLARTSEPAKEPVRVFAIPSPALGRAFAFRGSRANLDRDARGRALSGVPGGWVEFGHDATNLYVHGRYEYNKFISYRGSVNLGHEWGRHDGVRVQFPDFDVTAFFDGTVVSSDRTLVFDARNSFAVKGRSVGDGFATFGYAIPLERLGLDAASVVGRTLAFNATFYNHDHREYKHFETPRTEKPLCGVLSFEERPADNLGKMSREACLKGTSWPDGKVTIVAETAERRAQLTAFTLASGLFKCGLKVLPFTGRDPDAMTIPEERIERASESARPDGYSVCVENWSLALRTTASEDCAYLSVVNDHVPAVKVLIDCPTTDCTVADGVVRAHAGAYATLVFEPKPRAVRELAAKPGSRRFVLEFVTTPVTGGVVMKGAVSVAKSVESYARVVREKGFDFGSRKKSCAAAWNAQLK